MLLIDKKLTKKFLKKNTSFTKDIEAISDSSFWWNSMSIKTGDTIQYELTLEDTLNLYTLRDYLALGIKYDILEDGALERAFSYIAQMVGTLNDLAGYLDEARDRK